MSASVAPLPAPRLCNPLDQTLWFAHRDKKLVEAAAQKSESIVPVTLSTCTLYVHKRTGSDELLEELQKYVWRTARDTDDGR